MSEEQTYRWHGAYGEPGSSGPNGRSTKTHGNKGIMAGVRHMKRVEAERRNAAYQERGRIPADPRHREIHEARLERQARDYNASMRKLSRSDEALSDRIAVMDANGEFEETQPAIRPGIPRR